MRGKSSRRRRGRVGRIVAHWRMIMVVAALLALAGWNLQMQRQLAAQTLRLQQHHRIILLQEDMLETLIKLLDERQSDIRSRVVFQ